MPEEKRLHQVFISYSRRDLAFVEQLAADLQAAGLDVWYDLSGLEGGSRWSREIEKAICDSQYVLVVLSPDSVASKWVEEEFLYASELGKKIIPLFHKPCALPFGYRTLHFIDIQGSKYKQKFNEILRSLDVKPVAQKESYPPEERFPPGWDETWQPSFDKSYSASKKSDDGKRQSIKPESKLEKPKSKGKPIQQRWIIVTIVIVLIGAVLAGVFGLPKLFPEPENTPEPTLTLKEKTVPTETIKVADEPSFTPKPSTTPTQAFIPTATSLPSEITDNFGVAMMLVPEGNFLMGSDENQEKIYLDAFYIDKYEVTNSRYLECVLAKGCSLPTDTKLGDINYYGNSEFADYPVIRVTRELAKDYCIWRGARLPTGSEWEKAARGTDGRIYPWGNETDIYSRANGPGSEDGFELIAPIGSFPLGVSPYGVFDMSGNVSEYVSDYRQSEWDSVEYPVYRGGSWIYRSPTESLEVTSWGLAYKWYVTYSDRGIRCAKDATP